MTHKQFVCDCDTQHNVDTAVNNAEDNWPRSVRLARWQTTPHVQQSINQSISEIQYLGGTRHLIVNDVLNSWNIKTSRSYISR